MSHGQQKSTVTKKKKTAPKEEMSHGQQKSPKVNKSQKCPNRQLFPPASHQQQQSHQEQNSDTKANGACETKPNGNGMTTTGENNIANMS